MRFKASASNSIPAPRMSKRPDDGSRSLQFERSAKAQKPGSNAEDESPQPPKATKRETDLTNFCSPYSDVSFARIEAKVPFKPDHAAPVEDVESTGSFKPIVPCTDPLEAELSRIIGLGWMEHRIDVEGGAGKLVLSERKAWEEIRKGAIVAAAEVEHELLLRLHMVNIAVAELEVPKAAWQGGWTWF